MVYTRGKYFTKILDLLTVNKISKTQSVHPKVSIFCISYNQEKYIAQTLDSFLMQKTDFAFEVIIGDDSSTDETPRIIADYAKKYPDIIKPILRKRNIGAQKNFVETLNQTKGEYIALCEGDDFWTDDTKLQKQFDFLSKNPDYSLCFHLVKVFYENEEKATETFPDFKNSTEFTLKELIKRNYIQTNSVMYRRLNYENIPVDILPLDWYLHLYHAKNGKIGFINEVMSAYRRHPGGIWWDSHSDMDKIWLKYGVDHFSMYCEIFKLFEGSVEYRDSIKANIFRTFGILLDIDRKYKETLAEKALNKYPNIIDPLMVSQADSINELEKARYHQEDVIRNQTAKIDELEVSLIQKQAELDTIKSSNAWKLLNTSRKYKNRILRNK